MKGRIAQLKDTIISLKKILNGPVSQEKRIKIINRISLLESEIAYINKC